MKEILAYYWPHVVVYKWPTILGLTTFAVGGVLDAAIKPLLYKKLIDTTALEVNAASLETLALTLFGVAVVILTYNILFRIADFAHTYAQSNIMKHLTDESFARVADHSQEFFSNTFVGALVAKVKRYTDSFEALHDAFAFNILMNGLTLVVTFGILLWIAPLLGSIFIVWLAVYVVITVWFLRRKIPKDIAHATSQSRTTGALADAISNILTVKMFARAKSEEETFADITKDQEIKRRNTWNWDTWQRMFQGLAVGIVEIAVIVGAVVLWSRGEITPGTIVLVQLYLISLFNITWTLGRQIARIVQALNDAKEMIEIFKTPPSVADTEHPEPVRITKGEIRFENVVFKYTGNKPVFKGLSLHIPAGEKVGLVGHSGAGKSTITKLILRFTDSESGRITIDGQDVTRVLQDDLRRSIAYVPQEPVLFHRSLRENIAYGKPNATEEEVISAARRAHAHDFIMNLPKGYDTLVGERGIKLSGGERQRIAIARAMLKDAPVLILDEATSSLDSISERHIQDALTELMKGRTTLVIAHRLSTVQYMDRILVFSEGAVIEDGTHTELIAKRDGTYRELWDEQSGGFLGE